MVSAFLLSACNRCDSRPLLALEEPSGATQPLPSKK
jgi:hypothetical protein